jgi:hypothetical protein
MPRRTLEGGQVFDADPDPPRPSKSSGDQLRASSWNGTFKTFAARTLGAWIAAPSNPGHGQAAPDSIASLYQFRVEARFELPHIALDIAPVRLAVDDIPVARKHGVFVGQDGFLSVAHR